MMKGKGRMMSKKERRRSHPVFKSDFQEYGKVLRVELEDGLLEAICSDKFKRICRMDPRMHNDIAPGDILLLGLRYDRIEDLQRNLKSRRDTSSSDLPEKVEFLCGRKDSAEPHSAYILCESCHEKFVKIRDGLLLGGAESPAFQRAERERMAMKHAHEYATNSYGAPGQGRINCTTAEEYVLADVILKYTPLLIRQLYSLKQLKALVVNIDDFKPVLTARDWNLEVHTALSLKIDDSVDDFKDVLNIEE